MNTYKNSNINIFLINLDSRKDRLEKMKERLRDFEFERIQAVEKTSLKIEENLKNEHLSMPELSCIASHIKALKKFLESNGKICCILKMMYWARFSKS